MVILKNKNNEFRKKNIKKHADFQNDYRKSSNFNNPIKNDILKVVGDGEVKLKNKSDIMTDSDKKKIAKVMDDCQQKTEMKPVGKQTDTNLNEKE